MHPYVFCSNVTKGQLSKSALIPIGEVPKVHVLACFFGCAVNYLPSSCFRLLLGASYKIIRAKQFRTQLLRDSIRAWQVGSRSFFLERVG